MLRVLESPKRCHLADVEQWHVGLMLVCRSPLAHSGLPAGGLLGWSDFGNVMIGIWDTAAISEAATRARTTEGEFARVVFTPLSAGPGRSGRSAAVTVKGRAPAVMATNLRMAFIICPPNSVGEMLPCGLRRNFGTRRASHGRWEDFTGTPAE
jgi:hypothetical protein